MTITRYIDSENLPVFHTEIGGTPYIAWQQIRVSNELVEWESSRMIGSLEDNELQDPEDLDPTSEMYAEVETAISGTIAVGEEY